jgi:hypothetical protein
MPQNEVFWQRPENAAIKYNNYVTNLRNARHRHTENKDQAALDSAGLAHDRRLFPKATHNSRNEPRWDEGDAQRWLRADMDADQHLEMTPMELHISRDEYVAYSLDVFRGHIHQEVRRRKFMNYLIEKNEKKKKKKK